MAFLLMRNMMEESSCPECGAWINQCSPCMLWPWPETCTTAVCCGKVASFWMCLARITQRGCSTKKSEKRFQAEALNEKLARRSLPCLRDSSSAALWSFKMLKWRPRLLHDSCKAACTSTVAVPHFCTRSSTMSSWSSTARARILACVLRIAAAMVWAYGYRRALSSNMSSCACARARCAGSQNQCPTPKRK